MPNTEKYHVPLLALSLLLAGCTVGPDYIQPDLGLPAGWFKSAEHMPPLDEKAAIDQAWWRHFHDPVLDRLIEKAASDNFDLKIASARIEEARAARDYAHADLFPTVTPSASVLRQGNRIAFPEPIPGISKPFNTFQAGFDASWELDLFGGKRRTVEADEATLQAQEASRDDVRVSLLAEVARTYMDIRQYQKQLVLAKDAIAAEQKTVSIVGERYHSGSTSKLDVSQSLAQLEQVETQLPYYENLLAQAEFTMDVLLGQQPGAAHAAVAQAKPIPVSDKALVLTAPAAVIANRPDIRAAEQQLRSATAQQGVAIAALFPDISLSGFFGLLNVNAGDLLKAGSKSWQAGGNVLLPILNYGKLSANIGAADARQQQALLSYQKSVIAALSDVERAVTAYARQEEFRQALLKTVTDNRQAANIAKLRYKDGLSSFVDVLDAQRTLYASESQLAQADGLVSQNLIAVYKSLGGGWSAQPLTPQSLP